MARSPLRRRPDGRPRDHRDDRSYRRRSSSRDVRERQYQIRRYDLTYAQRHYDSRDRNRYDPRRDRDRDRDYYGERRDERPRGSTDDYRAPRRSRSTERKRSRDRRSSPVRDDRRRSRESQRRDRDVYDDRDRKRQKRDASAQDGQVCVGSRDNLSKAMLNVQTSRPPTVDTDANTTNGAVTAEKDEQAKQAAKRARVEAWKKNLLESKTTSDKVASPAASSPPTSQPITAEGSPAPAIDDPVPDMAPRDKFDHKLIKKRAAEKISQNMEKAALGGDAIIPTSTVAAPGTNRPNVAASMKGTTGGEKLSANRPAAPALLAGEAKITGFDLNKSSADKAGDNFNVAKPVAALDEEDDIQREIKRLPETLLNDSIVYSSVPAATEDIQDESEAEDLQSDEEEAEAVREAAQKRAEAQANQQDSGMDDSAGAQSHDQSNDNMDVDEDDIDPLDAYMSSLEQAQNNAPLNLPNNRRGAPQTQRFDDDVDGADLDTVGDNPEDLLNNPKRKKKDIPTVDHSKMNYREFRKNFYSQPAEIADMSEDEIAKLRAELDDMTVRGSDVPHPITKWAQCGFTSQILDVLRDQKFASPTSIQCQALPALMSGRDTIGVAKTGSGKTLAFILPMFRHIQDQPRVQNLEGPIGLIIAPTRELAVQIHSECKPYLKALGLRGVCTYGGAPIKDQIAELKRGAEVVVCTPGRIIDLLAANSGRVTNLNRVTYIVLDEADRMFDMGFEPQITKTLKNIRPNRQTVLFSATFPWKMEQMARKALNNPIQIITDCRSKVAPEITQKIEVVEEDAKLNHTLGLLGDFFRKEEDVRCLIFVEKQESADELFKKLDMKGYKSRTMHGGAEQVDRMDAIRDFKSGLVKVLVATSVAARGLDVKQLNLVINYDSPNHGEDYVHRAGRTGRAGNTGTAVTFVTPQQDRFAPFLVRTLKDSNHEVPKELQDLATIHKQKLKAGEAQKVSSGFGGKGIERLDAARAAERAWEKKQFKTGDEPDEEDESKDKAVDPALSAVDKLVAKAVTEVKGRDTMPEPLAEPAAVPGIPESLADHLNNAMKVRKSEKDTSAKAEDPLAKVNAAAASINNRIGTKGKPPSNTIYRSPELNLHTGSTRPVDNRGPDAGAFHATLEINDFPQKARWAVTNRTNVYKVLESTGVSITTKGNYYPNAPPGPLDAPKLYILVEAETEIAVASAMKELVRHLTEGIVAAQNEEAKGGGNTKGRYTVT